VLACRPSGQYQASSEKGVIYAKYHRRHAWTSEAFHEWTLSDSGKRPNFGRSRTNNQQVAKPNRQGINAAPNRGQAFVIVSMDMQSKYPFHAAAVVAEDKDDRVTIEVFATDQDAKDTDRTTAGDFQMYALGDLTHSFHGVWNENDGFGDAEPCTIVIEPNNL
jgi:hypothetical protein